MNLMQMNKHLQEQHNNSFITLSAVLPLLLFCDINGLALQYLFSASFVEKHKRKPREAVAEETLQKENVLQPKLKMQIFIRVW